VVDEIEVVGGHTKFFAMWPLYFDQQLGLGTSNLSHSQGWLPFYTRQQSPQRESYSYAWPLYTYTIDHERNYREWDFPWPLVGFARGGGKTMNRVWPLYSEAFNTNLLSDFFLWPLYKHNQFKTEAVQRDRSRVLFYVYSDLVERYPGTNQPMRRTDFWPLFTARRDHNGNERLQILALFEPVLPQRKSMERNYSPLWSVWRSEKNPKTGAASQSFLWNLFRSEKTANSQEGSAMFGLFQYHASTNGTRLRILYVPLNSEKKAAAKTAQR
jgi:hypothetical protein